MLGEGCLESWTLWLKGLGSWHIPRSTINTLCEGRGTVPCLPFIEEEGPRTCSRVLTPCTPPQKPSSRKDCTRTHVEASIPPSVHHGHPLQSPHVGQPSPAPLSGVTSAMKLGISGHTRNLAGHPPYATSVIHAGDSARSGNSLPAEARP